MVGRPIDITSDDVPIEGDTQALFVSRFNIFDDGMGELLAESPPPVFNIPLETTFYGEKAQDYGGPRKEFLSAMCREIKDRLFKKSDDGEGYTLAFSDYHFTRQHYYGAGIVTGQ